jgi:type IV pilus assembly protein PilO
MPRNFKLPSIPLTALPVSALKDPQVRTRIGLGVLLLANLVAAVFAFHLFDDSPEQVNRQVLDTRKETLQQLKKLNQARQLASKVEKGREQGTRFIDTYMTSRRNTYSTIIKELNETASKSSVKPKDAIIGLDAIQGTDNLDVLTVTASFEGGYKGLLLFINQLDASKRFLIIESLSAAPQQNGLLAITLKLNTFVKEDAKS